MEAGQCSLLDAPSSGTLAIVATEEAHQNDPRQGNRKLQTEPEAQRSPASKAKVNENMSAEDYFYDPDTDDDQPTIVACKRCGKGGLHWENDDGQWNLYDGRYRLHRCDMQKAAADDFEVVE